MSAETTSDGTTTETVFRLIYRSHSLIGAGNRSSELASIFTSARRNNRGHDITGALMVTDSTFVQTLEGVEAEVRELFGVIEGDGRHDEVEVLEQTPATRTFGRWAMAEVVDGRSDTRLVSNTKSGEIVAMGKDPSITPDQEHVLSYMREAATD